MDTTNLGSSGLQVSRIALGCMSFGDPGRGGYSWTLPEEQAAPFFREAVELGITFWDTANAYSDGSSEEIVGRAITEYASREEIVLATKLYYPMHGGPGGSGLSRKAVMEQIDGSLRRLGTDYVDLYQIHRFDPDVPVEETMQALDDLVRAGKVRHLGASSMWAWQFAKLQHAADRAVRAPPPRVGPPAAACSTRRGRTASAPSGSGSSPISWTHPPVTGAKLLVATATATATATVSSGRATTRA